MSTEKRLRKALTILENAAELVSGGGDAKRYERKNEIRWRPFS